MSSGYIPVKGKRGPNEILKALYEAVSDNPPAYADTSREGREAARPRKALARWSLRSCWWRTY